MWPREYLIPEDVQGQIEWSGEQPGVGNGNMS